MTPSEYLDQIKAKIGVESDYALAHTLDIPKQRISAWRASSAWPDAYACARIAVTLNLNPQDVIADIESQREKNPKRAEFWRSFVLEHQRKAAAWMLGIVSAACFGMASTDDARASETNNLSLMAADALPASSSDMMNVYYVKYWQTKAISWLKKKVASALDSFATYLPRFGFAGS